MEPINHYSLEKYAERHRADFDLHEPRPELWAALEKQLDGEAAPKMSQPVMSVVGEEDGTSAPIMTVASTPQPTSAPNMAAATLQPQLRTSQAKRAGRWQPVGVAAALVALLLAAGLGEVWKASHRAVVAEQPTAGSRSAATDAALYLGADPDMLAASQGGPQVDARLDTAVHGMERFYVAQLTDRKAQLSQLAPDATADWARELVGLDSSYQQLKRELPRHPQPEVVLTAMNRNLQIRLDILDRQLEMHAGDRAALAGGGTGGGEYVLADSRVVADNVRVQPNGR